MRSLLNNTRWSVVGAALIAVLVLSVAAATASAALPEFETETGRYPDKFTMKGSTFLVETPTKAQGLCEMSGTGAITGPKTGTATLKLTRCHQWPGFCHAVGRPEEVETTELEVIPVYVESKTRVALEFKPKVGTKVATLACAGSNIANGEIAGSILAVFTPTNVNLTEFRTIFEERVGVQSPSRYESGGLVNSWLEIRWNEKPFERLGWNGEAVVRTEARVTLIA
jgi:hypothetical protein